MSAFILNQATLRHYGRQGAAHLPPNTKGQRREPAAGGVRFVSERIGWLPFAAPSGWRIGRPPRTFIFAIAARTEGALVVGSIQSSKRSSLVHSSLSGGCCFVRKKIP